MKELVTYFRRLFSMSINVVYFLIFSCILLISIFSYNFVYTYKITISNYNFLLLMMGIISLIFFVIVFKNLKLSNKKLSLIAISLFIIQLILIYHYYFITGWDVLEVFSNAQFIANNQIHLLNNEYYSRYPNNLLLTFIISKILSFSNFIGLKEYGYFIVIVCQAVLNMITGVLIFKVSKRLFQNDFLSIFSYGMYVVILWFSPWTSIPYSDAMGLILPIFIFYVYTTPTKRELGRIVKVISLGGLTAIGYFIKPQTIIITIAIFLVTVIYKKVKIKTKLKYIIISLLAFVTFRTGISVLNGGMGFVLNKEAEFTYHHFVKMGLNSTTDGGYLSQDVMDSLKINSKEERIEFNKQVIKERIKAYGLMGLLNHQVKKTLNNFNDGTFGWGLEGNFYKKIKPTNSWLAQIVRSFYYKNTKLRVVYEGIVQCAWLLILFLMIFISFYKQDENREYILVLQLCLIGFFIFESIFESRSRYAYTYVPIFIIVATAGLDVLKNKIRINKTEWNHKK